MSTHGVRRNTSLLQRVIGLLLPGRTQEVDDPRARTWARAVKSLAELPAAYRPFFESLQPDERDPFPYTVLTPTFKGGYGRAQTEHLLCILDGAVHVLETTEGRLCVRRYSPASTNLLERGSILLHAWITIHGEDQDGALCSTTVRFNSVTDQIMAPFVESLRPPVVATAEVDLVAERSRFGFLAPTHFKFMSYGQNSVRPGEKVLQILLQPQIREELMRLFGFSLSRLVSPAHLIVLTDSELIVIRDDESQRWVKGSPHGAIWTYIPRLKIIDAALNPTEDGRQILSIGVPGGLRVESLFEAGSKPQVEQLLKQLRVETAR